jgi:thioredoxin-like negative regulator of GroEL
MLFYLHFSHTQAFISEQIMTDEEVELDVEQETVAPSTFPVVSTMADFKEKVLDDEEFLVVVVVHSTLCSFSQSLLPFFTSLSEPKPQTTKARFVQVVVPGGEEIFNHLRLSRTPAVLFFLKGQQRGDTFIGSNKEKIEGLFRNELISRNEEMREYDEAKLAAMLPTEAEGEEETEEKEEDE